MGRRGLLLIALTLAALLAQGCAVGRYFYDRGRDLTDCVRVEAGLGPGIGVQVKGAGILDSGLVLASTPRQTGFAWNYGRGHVGGQGDAYEGAGWDNTVDLTLPVQAAMVGLAVGGVAAGRAVHEASNGTGGEATVYAAAIPIGLALGPPIWAGYQREETGGSRGTPGFTLAWESYATQQPDARWRRADKQTNGFLPAYYTWIRREAPGQRYRKGAWLWSHQAQSWSPRAHIHAFDVEASVWAGVAYGRAGFSIGEFADFLTGIVGWDLARDDGARRSQR
jgi:hypothetical protein